MGVFSTNITSSVEQKRESLAGQYLVLSEKGFTLAQASGKVSTFLDDLSQGKVIQTWALVLK